MGADTRPVNAQRGRPKLEEDDARRIRLQAMFTMADFQAIEALAEEERISVSTWIYRRIREVLEKRAPAKK
jgi:hypothetical protein